jgi:hypothetical protein
MDSLEKFIKENRESLDRYEPSPHVWDRITGQRVIINRKLLVRISAAAAIIVILGSATFIYTSVIRKNKPADLSGEVREMELFYNSLANTLYLQAKPMLTSQPDIEKELKNDLQRIDNICSEIKNDLKDNVSNQEVIEALIQNYTIKIHILEDMLRILKENENKPEKRKSNEL